VSIPFGASLSYIPGGHSFKFGFYNVTAQRTSDVSDNVAHLTYQFLNCTPNQPDRAGDASLSGRATADGSRGLHAGRVDARPSDPQLRTGVNFELYNIFNSNTVLTENNTYRDATLARWRIPTSIVPPRFIKLSVQMDF
jgi:hypothetical protein